MSCEICNTEWWNDWLMVWAAIGWHAQIALSVNKLWRTAYIHARY